MTEVFIFCRAAFLFKRNGCVGIARQSFSIYKPFGFFYLAWFTGLKYAVCLIVHSGFHMGFILVK